MLDRNKYRKQKYILRTWDIFINFSGTISTYTERRTSPRKYISEQPTPRNYLQ